VLIKYRGGTSKGAVAERMGLGLNFVNGLNGSPRCFEISVCVTWVLLGLQAVQISIPTEEPDLKKEKIWEK